MYSLTIFVRDQNIEKAIKKLQLAFWECGVKKELKKRAAHETKGQRERRKRNEATRRITKRRRRLEEFRNRSG